MDRRRGWEGLPRLWVLVSLLVPVLLLAMAGWQRRWVSDDGFIYVRVVEQVLAGHGPVFNAGERVEAATSPLWVLILSIARVILPVPTEWIAVVLGLLGTVVGLLLASLGALSISNASPGEQRIAPLGALTVAALPPMWDFATSGLETGLGFFWLGGCFFILARRYTRVTTREGSNPRSFALVAAVVGLGPLVRPDFALFSGAFLFTLLLSEKGSSRRRLAMLGAALAVPVAFELFRMGYYAALVPNTALAKEASSVRWPEGWQYLADLFVPYWLLLPVLVGVVCAAGAALAAPARQRRPRSALLVGATLAGGLVHGLYVVRVGGDFMHGRLLLPAVFALAMPAAVVSADSAFRMAAPALTLAWALVGVASAGLGPPPTNFDLRGIVDERAYYVELAQRPNPVSREDYRETGWYQQGQADKRLAAAGRPVLGLRVGGRGDISELRSLQAGWGSGAVVVHSSIGIASVAAGTAVHIVDSHGLADALAARLRLDARGRAGHEKILDDVWVIARFARAHTVPAEQATSSSAVRAARRALGCDGLRDVEEAVTSPLTRARFLANLGQAVRLHGFRFPGDPFLAERQLCST